MSVCVRHTIARSMSSKPAADFAPSTSSASGPGFFNGLSLWEKVQSSLAWLPRWRPTSDAHLQQAEQHILDTEISSDYTNHYVNVSQDAVIRTVTMEPDTPTSQVESVPLVMVHGFGAGLLQFYKNLDHLHGNRRLLAFDLPGFGRSSRIKFPRDPVGAESQFVDVMEEWREGMGVQKFVLLGHSLGGYLATAYTIRHPERVSHLVLVDPWGFTEPPSREQLEERFTPFQRLTWQAISKLRPFTAVRAAGPWGPDLVKRMRKDLARTFGAEFLDYVYHCNARNPTGEEAFYHMQYYFGWARNPMLSRLTSDLHPSVPITVISGARSWLDAVNRDRLDKTANLIKRARPEGAYVGVEVLEGAGHHLHAEQPQEFNQLVQEVLTKVDNEVLTRVEGEVVRDSNVEAGM